MTLTAGNTPICKVQRMFGRVLEYNPLSTIDNAIMATRRPTTPKSTQLLMAKGSLNLWHRRLAYLGQDMMKTLPTPCEGVQLEAATEMNPNWYANSQKLNDKSLGDKQQVPPI